MADSSAGDSSPALTDPFDVHSLEAIAADIMAEPAAADSSASVALYLRFFANFAEAFNASATAVLLEPIDDADDARAMFTYAADIETIFEGFNDAAAALTRVRSAAEGKIRGWMASHGVDAQRANGWRFAISRRNDMTIVDLDAAIRHAEAIGATDKITAPAKIDRSLVLKLARDLEDIVPLEGCARVASTAFTVKKG